jgi:hypothetical protein
VIVSHGSSGCIGNAERSGWRGAIPTFLSLMEHYGNFAHTRKAWDIRFS